MRQGRDTAVGVISICIVVTLCYGVVDFWSTIRHDYALSTTNFETFGSGPSLPDFGHYKELRTLGRDDFPIDDSDRRVILVGDIHGMIGPFKKLLRKVNYQPRKDVLIHTGDIITRGSLKGSLEVLNFLSSHNITGVRGNNDQKVVEWRAWFDWIISRPGGLRWLERLETKWEDVQDDEPPLDLDDFLEFERQNSNSQDRKWWQTIPKGWKPLSNHYLVARAMTARHTRYLLDLPLRLHAPHAHTFIVHAGLLPANPKWSLDDRRQPLAQVPRVSGSHKRNTEMLRQLQEVSILTSIAPNRDPWTPLNMRSILKGGRLTRDATRGKYWTKLWKKQMKSCVGFDKSIELDNSAVGVTDSDGASPEFTIQARGKKPSFSLPCYPSTVIYGHTASRGKDINRWSFGLDTGCVYGRKLSALVVGRDPTILDDSTLLNYGEVDEEEADEEEADEDEEDYEEDEDMVEPTGKESKPIPIFSFGDSSEARMVSVRC